MLPAGDDETGAAPSLRERFEAALAPGPARVMSNRLDQLDWLLLAVTPQPEAIERAHNRITSTADAAMARALGNPPAAEVAEVIGALEMVAERLGPLGRPHAAQEAS